MAGRTRRGPKIARWRKRTAGPGKFHSDPGGRVLNEVPLGRRLLLVTMAEKVVAQIGDQSIVIESGKLAKQADGAVTVQLGETIVVVAAVAATKAKPGQEFFPLTVDYREKAAAAGRFPGGYFKREGRPPKRKSSPAASSTAPSARSSPRAGSMRFRSRPSSSAPTARTTPMSSPPTAPRPRSSSQRHPLGRSRRSRPRRPCRRSIRRQPHPRPDSSRATSTSSTSATNPTW
jgi:hypothetical protein